VGKRGPKRTRRRSAPSIERTRPNWLLRAFALGVAAHAIYVGTPLYAPPADAMRRLASGWAVTNTTLGRSVLIVVELAFAVLLWLMSTRRMKDAPARWYHR
jgi:hypothetical protein